MSKTLKRRLCILLAILILTGAPVVADDGGESAQTSSEQQKSEPKEEKKSEEKKSEEKKSEEKSEDRKTEEKKSEEQSEEKKSEEKSEEKKSEEKSEEKQEEKPSEEKPAEESVKKDDSEPEAQPSEEPETSEAEQSSEAETPAEEAPAEGETPAEETPVEEEPVEETPAEEETVEEEETRAVTGTLTIYAYDAERQGDVYVFDGDPSFTFDCTGDADSFAYSVLNDNGSTVESGSVSGTSLRLNGGDYREGTFRLDVSAKASGKEFASDSIRFRLKTEEKAKKEVLLEGPAQTTLTVSVEKSEGSANVSWNAVDGATSYSVTVTDSEGGTAYSGSTSGASLELDTAVYADGTYTVKVVAQDDEGGTLAEGSAALEIGAQSEEPAKPTLSVSVEKSDSSANVSWNAVDGATSYSVTVTDSEGGTAYSGSTSGASLELDTAAYADGTYTIKVVAQDDEGVTLAEGSAALEIGAQPEEPALTVSVEKSEGSANVSWNAVDNAATYSVTVTDAEGGTVYSGSASETSLTINTAEYADGTYTVKVVAQDDEGGTLAEGSATLESGQEKPASETLDLKAVGAQDMRGMLVFPENAAFEWNNVIDAAYYTVVVTDQKGAEILRIDTTDTAFSPAPGTLGQEMYTISVIAVNEAGETLDQASLSFSNGGGRFPGGFPGGRGGWGGFGGFGGFSKGSFSMPAGMGMEMVDPGFHIVPGEALTDDHVSGDYNMDIYETVDLTAPETAVTALTLDETEMALYLDDGAKPFTVVCDESRLQLIPEDGGNVWNVNGAVLKTLAKSGVDSIQLTLNGKTIALNTDFSFTGRVYAALRAEGYVAKDTILNITSEGITAEIGGGLYNVSENGELTPAEV